jgi:hypothetical protein
MTRILHNEISVIVEPETFRKIIASAAMARAGQPHGEAAIDLWHLMNETYRKHCARRPLDVRPSDHFSRTLTLYDGPWTREKATVMDKWDVMTDDERNPDFEGLDKFLEWGSTYRITIEKV